MRIFTVKLNKIVIKHNSKTDRKNAGYYKQLFYLKNCLILTDFKTKNTLIKSHKRH